MHRRLLAPGVALVLAMGCSSPADAATRADCDRQYTPQRGQSGKDVIWVPTGDVVVARMLELADVRSADNVYDLGAGDGKIVIAAAKRFGARAVGIEYDANLASYAQCLVEAEGVSDRVEIVQGDIFETDFRDATVVTLYLLPELNLRLRPTLLDMKPGTRVVSYSFTMGDWEPDDYAETDEGLAYLWTVPAKVDGVWTFEPRAADEPFDVRFEQTFQNLEGSAAGTRLAGKLNGRTIDFVFVLEGAGPVRFNGTVDGDRISGTVTRDGDGVDYIGTRTN